MKTMAVAVLLTLASFCSIAQQSEKGEVWASPMAGVSTLNGNNKVLKHCKMDANAISSGVAGFELGYNFTRAYMFFSLEEEVSSMSDDISRLKINSTNVSVNFAYPVWRSAARKYSFDVRVGVGMYNSEMTFATTAWNIPVGTEVVEQRYNMFVPVGLTFVSKFTEDSKLRVSLIYRHSFDTGTNKLFGAFDMDSDYPLNKLSSLYLTVGYSFGI